MKKAWYVEDSGGNVTVCETQEDMNTLLGYVAEDEEVIVKSCGPCVVGTYKVLAYFFSWDVKKVAYFERVMG